MKEPGKRAVGNPDPTLWHSVGWALPHAPLVGRDSEVERLSQALGEAGRGRGAAFALVGAAGIGKTRLAGEICELARDVGLRLGVARCMDVEGAPAYWPWIEILRSLARDHAPAAHTASGLEDLYGLLSLLGVDVPPVQAMGDEARFALLDAVVRVLTQSASDKPLVLFLDDLHWADADSLVLLRELARRCNDHPLLLLGAYRDEVTDTRRNNALAGYERAAQRLSLAGLEIDGAARLVEWSTGQQPTAKRVRQLLERSDGNPLFLTELAVLPAETTLPESIRHALAPRFDGLSPAARSVLAIAAVVGAHFDLAALAPLVGVSGAALEDALEELRRRGLLVRTARDAYAFAHALIHEAAYDDVRAVQRAEIHQRIAASLETSGAATEAERARLAHHLSQADDSDSLARAVEHATRAAELASDGLALHRAADHLGLALRAQRRLQPETDAHRRRRLELLLTLGRVQGAVGTHADARASYTEATDLARALDDASALGKAAAGWVGFEEAPLEFSPEALARIEEALAALEGSDAPERAGLLAVFTHFLWFWRRFDRCEAVAREAVACAERTDDPLHRVHAMNALHRSLNDPQCVNERLELSKSAVALAAERTPRHVEAMARRRLAMDLLQRGDIAEGRRELLHVTRIWEELRKPVDGWSIAALRATVALLGGDLDTAERLITDVLRLGREVESRIAPVIFISQLYRLREHQGRLDEIVELLQRQVEAHPAVPALAWTLRLAWMHLGRDDELRESFDRAAAQDFDDIPRDENWSPVLCAAAQIAHHLGDRPRAARIRELLLPYDGLCVVVGYGHYWVGAAARYLALLDWTLGREEARAHFAAAIDSHRRAGARALLAETAFEFGRWLVERGENERARACFEESADGYRRLGLEHFADRVDAAHGALTLRASTSSGTSSSTPSTAPARDSFAAAPQTARLEKVGERWRIDFGGTATYVTDRKGMADLAQLVESPGRELHVLDLMDRAPVEAGGVEPGLRIGSGPSGDSVLDAPARAAYRARHAELRSDLDDARSRHDTARVQALREEIDWLEAELRGAMRGGDSPAFVQRARKAVYNRIRNAIRSIEQVQPELGRHLRHGIQTGAVCRYMPERALRWEVDAG